MSPCPLCSRTLPGPASLRIHVATAHAPEVTAPKGPADPLRGIR